MIKANKFYGLLILVTSFITTNYAYSQTEEIEGTCGSKGYILTSCNVGMKPANFCPSDNSLFKDCICDSDVYPFDTLNCIAPKTPSGESCDNKYKECNCPAEYNKTCTPPLVGTNGECGGNYIACSCPPEYKTCQRGPASLSPECTEESGAVKYTQCFGFDCEENGYLTYIPSDSTCTELTEKGSTCYTDCKPKK